MDVIDRLAQTDNHGVILKLHMQEKLIEHKRNIGKDGEDMPEIRNGQWPSDKPVKDS